MKSKKCIPIFCLCSFFLILNIYGKTLEVRYFFLPSLALSIIYILFTQFSIDSRENTFNLVFLSIFLFFLMNTHCFSEPSLGFNKSIISNVQGKLIYDSSFSSSGNSILTIRLCSCKNVFGNTSSANGIITAVIKGETTLSTGVCVNLTGKFAESYFIVDEITITDKSLICFFREKLIFLIRQRICPGRADPAPLLSIQLILGKTEDYFSEIKNKAALCGCTHVLALSGMHLNVLASICRLPGKRKPISKILTVLAVSLFLFCAGPRPSLIRASLMLAFSFLPAYERTILTLSVHCILFPGHFSDIGCVYAYISTFALTFVSPYLSYGLSVKIPEFPAGILGASLSVVIFNAPLQMLSTGHWYIASVLAGPVAGVFASLSMIMGFLLTGFGENPVFTKINGLIYEAMLELFNVAGSLPECGITAYIVFTLSSVIVCLTGCKVFQCLQNRRKLLRHLQ